MEKEKKKHGFQEENDIFGKVSAPLYETIRHCVALANGGGGRLIIKYPKSPTVRSSRNMLQMAGRIGTALQKECIPAIRFDVKFFPEKDKLYLVIRIAEGSSPPYMMKENRGLTCYVRHKGETVPTDRHRLKAMICRKNGGFADAALTGRRLTQKDVEKFSREMEEFSQLICRHIGEPEIPLRWSPEMMEMNGILTKVDDMWIANEAYLYLEGTHPDKSNSGIILAVEEDSRDEMELFEGGLHRQVFGAVSRVAERLKKHFSKSDEGIVYCCELPVPEWAALLSGLVVSRDYGLKGRVKIHLTKEALMLQVPGIFDAGYRSEDMNTGVGMVRNRGLLCTFLSLNLFRSVCEAYLRLENKCVDYGLEKPDLKRRDDMLILQIRRKKWKCLLSEKDWIRAGTVRENVKSEQVTESPETSLREVTLYPGMIDLSPENHLLMEEEFVASYLRRGYRATLRALTKEMGHSMANTKIIVERMISKGLVSIGRIERKRRLVLIEDPFK